LSAAELLAALSADEATPVEPDLPPALLDKITTLFLQEAPLRLAALHEAFRRKDAVTLGREAHTLKGNVRYFRAHHLAQLAARTEILADQGRLEALAPLLAEIDTAHAILREQLRPNPIAQP
jgi:HPt (histidine-containing phosphotransfer) domain-containing protein